MRDNYSDNDDDAGGFEEEYLEDDYDDKPKETKAQVKNDFWEAPKKQGTVASTVNNQKSNITSKQTVSNVHKSQVSVMNPINKPYQLMKDGDDDEEDENYGDDYEQDFDEDEEENFKVSFLKVKPTIENSS